MPIKYGELTIIYNEEEITVFSSLLMWLSYDIEPPKKSNFVFLFEDGEICDTKDKLKDFKFNFFDSSFRKTPIYFEKKIENHLKLNCKPLFSAYSKYNISMGKPSQYNCIYYCHKLIEKTEIFGLMRINSSEIMPRFQFAYDSSEFTKDEIMYLIYYIFRL